MRFQTGSEYNNVTIVKTDQHEFHRVRDGHRMEFNIQTMAPSGGGAAMTRLEMTELHEALGEMLGLTTPCPTSPLTASVPAKNPRRVNGGL